MPSKAFRFHKSSRNGDQFLQYESHFTTLNIFSCVISRQLHHPPQQMERTEQNWSSPSVKTQWWLNYLLTATWACIIKRLSVGQSTTNWKFCQRFNHPRVIQNLFTFLSSVEHKRYFGECQTISDLEKSMKPKTVWLPKFFKIIQNSFIFHSRKKVIQRLERHEK